MSQTAQLVGQLEALTTDQPMTPAREGQSARPALSLKQHQVQAFTEEMRRLGDQSAGVVRDPAGQRLEGVGAGDRVLATRRAKEIRKILEAQAPKRITGDRANQVYTLAKRLRDEVFTPNMLPESAARRSPAGAPGHIQRTEFTPLWNRAAVAYKRAVRALDPENPDPDLTNINRFRPKGEGANGVSTFDVNAVIPGNFAYGEQAKANWPFDAPTADTALAQVQRREATETAAPGVAVTTTDKRRAALAKARAARSAKRGASQSQPTALEG